MDHLFPYDHIVAGVLILIVGFGFHWIGQLISIINWGFAKKIGLQETKMLPEHKVYEHAIAVADVLIGWTYGVAAIGLLLNTDWGYKMAWFPGVVLLYHSLSFWFWTHNRNKAGQKLESDTTRVLWTMANFVTGSLAIVIAWLKS